MPKGFTKRAEIKKLCLSMMLKKQSEEENYTCGFWEHKLFISAQWRNRDIQDL